MPACQLQLVTGSTQGSGKHGAVSPRAGRCGSTGGSFVQKRSQQPPTAHNRLIKALARISSRFDRCCGTHRSSSYGQRTLHENKRRAELLCTWRRWPTALVPLPVALPTHICARRRAAHCYQAPAARRPQGLWRRSSRAAGSPVQQWSLGRHGRAGAASWRRGELRRAEQRSSARRGQAYGRVDLQGAPNLAASSFTSTALHAGAGESGEGMDERGCQQQ